LSAAAVTPVDDFGADLRRSLAVWRAQPLLPIISMTFWTLPGLSLDDAVYFVVAIVFLFFLGWPGTEREWYRRAFAGERFPPSEIWPTSRRFWGPFVRLGLLLSPFLVVVLGVMGVIGWETPPAIVFSVVLFFVLDVALTFVTPALTFTTPSARRALSIGVDMLRAQWPAAAPYALTPALVVILGTQTVVQPLTGPVGAFIGSAVAGLFALALKGATVAFYLRHPPAPTS
jgi:hypothetical protein